MIDNVVSSIIEAENCAKSMLQDAEQKASELLSETDILIDTTNKNAAAALKSDISVKLQEAQSLAARESASYIQSKTQEINEEVAAYRKNLKSAIKIITEKVQ